MLTDARDRTTIYPSAEMVLDYSKWDALELSDDSDIEVHPNVDKRSFIRAKQNQIHQQRQQRRHEIATLGYERIINDGLLKRIDGLLTALKKHESDSRNPDELVFQALIESAGDPKEDQPPAPPENVHSQETQPKYSQMMGSLVDQVKKELDESKPENRYQAFITGVEGHKTKVLDLQQQLLEKLAQLEKEEGRKITSDSIHTGFDSSFVSSSKSKSEPKKVKESTVELLNPGSASADNMDAVSSGAEADIEDGEGDEEGITVRPLTKQFAKFKIGDYREAYSFITDHPQILTEKRTDELLMEAFNAQISGDETYARQCVHYGLLLQYCRSLGKDGVSLFFKRLVSSSSSFFVPKDLTQILLMFYCKTGSLQRTIVLVLCSVTMLTTPTTVSRPAQRNLPNRLPRVNQKLNKSNFTQSTPLLSSTSLFLQLTAKMKPMLLLATSLTASRRVFRKPWNLKAWMK